LKKNTPPPYCEAELFTNQEYPFPKEFELEFLIKIAPPPAIP
jgi:hypothetical protein